ncbi:transcription factor SOX1/3/14/21 (SOX group B) [Sarotherodon galilaeus]
MDRFLTGPPHKRKAGDEASPNMFPNQLPSKSKSRKYGEAHLPFGFTCTSAKVLFNTPIYETAVKICWYLPGYRTQIAIMIMIFLRLQQDNLIPPNVTAEDLRDLLVEKSRELLLWEFELEDFEEEEAKPLLRLAIFTCSIRDNMIDSILTEIRQKFPQEILCIKIANFAPVLLKTIADVAMIRISEIFEPPSTLPDVKNTNEERSSDGLSMANVPPAEGSFSESVPVPDVLCEELLAERASSLSSQDLKIEGSISESVPEPDVLCEELAESSSSLKAEDLTIEGPLSEIGPVPDVPCEELDESSSSLKAEDPQSKGLFQKVWQWLTFPVRNPLPSPNPVLKAKILKSKDLFRKLGQFLMFPLKNK